METTKVLMAVAVFAVLIAAVNMVATFAKVSETKAQIAGFASSEQGNATLEVVGIASIIFSNNLINWSDGAVDVANGFTYANLTSNNTLGGGAPVTPESGNRTAGSYGNAGDAGSFNNVTRGLVIENVGNSNVSLMLNSSLNAALLIGGTSPLFQWQLNQVTTDDTGGATDGEANSCKLGGLANGLQYATWTDVPYGGVGYYVCGNLTQVGNNGGFNNEVEIDLRLAVPQDAPTGKKNATITATAAVIPN